MRSALQGLALSLLVALLAFPAAHAQDVAARVDCAEWTQVVWPATTPLWEFEVRRPARSSATRGSGLEMRNVRYRGRTVAARIHTPVISVEYDADGDEQCGCFRDFGNFEAPLELGPTTRRESCFAITQPGSVQAACDAGTGADVGDFRGVALEDFDDRLVVTSHLQAGWYRYKPTYVFHRDGRIETRFTFTSTPNYCTQFAHRHHVYWRFDLDIEGAADDRIRQTSAADPQGTVLADEQRLFRGEAALDRAWVVEDAVTGRGYRLQPGPGDFQLPTDAFADADGYALRFQTVSPGGAPIIGEFDDGGGQCAFDPVGGGLLNGEAILDTDLVLWYRAGYFHPEDEAIACDEVGPTLVPVGDWGQAAPPPAVAPFLLRPAFPNPFTRRTTVQFTLFEAVPVRVLLFDSAGRQVAVLYEGTPTAYVTEAVQLDAGALPAGTYTVRLVGPTFGGSTQAVLVR